MTLQPSVYVDLLDVPLDTPPPDVGDWMADGSHELAEVLQLQAAGSLAPATSAALIVPFTRLIKRGTRGQDVEGAKRAIWRANDLPVGDPFTTLFGKIAVTQLQEFQHRKSLKADGELGPATLHALAPYFDRYAFWLYEGYKYGTNPTQAKRDKMLAYLLWGFNQRALIYYAQFRPMELLLDLYHLPVSEDCSTFYTKGAKAAGWKDPNGFNFNGTGNTETLVVHGKRVMLAEAKVGDAVLYLNPQHVAGYVGHGRVIGLGSTAGPSLTMVDYRPDLWQIRTYL